MGRLPDITQDDKKAEVYKILDAIWTESHG